MTASELLPCPFCAAEISIVPTLGNLEEQTGVHPHGPPDGCLLNGCKIASVNWAAWNTRAMKAAEPLQQGDEVSPADVARKAAASFLDPELAGGTVIMMANGKLDEHLWVRIANKAIDEYRAALVRSKLPIAQADGSLVLDNASVQRLMDYGLLHRLDDGWHVGPWPETNDSPTAIGSQSIEGERANVK